MLEGLNYPNPHQMGCYWHDTAQNWGAPNLKWCETTLCEVISEPANTWSNLGYIILGFVMIYLFRKSSKSVQLIAPTLIATGIGSYYYHMSNFYLSQICDFIGMFIMMYWFIALNLQRLKGISFKQSIAFMAFMTIISTLALHLLYINHLNIQFLIVICVLMLLSLEFKIRQKDKTYSLKYLIIALSLLAIAEMFSLLDLKRVICQPDNHYFQGHATWHIIGSIGLFVAGLFYKQFDKELK